MIYAIDLDLTLTKDVSWTEEDALRAVPNTERIQAVNTLYGPNVVVIYTARVEPMRAATVFWLTKHGVKYHALIMGKLPADVYVDDKAMSDTDFFATLKGKEGTTVESEVYDWYLKTHGAKRSEM